MEEYGAFKTDRRSGSAEEDLARVSLYMELINEAMVKAGGETDPLTSINIFLESMGKDFCADRAYIFELNNNGTYDNTFEWCSKGVSSEKERLQGLSESVIPEWIEAFRAGHGYMVNDMDQYRTINRESADLLVSQHIDRVVECPLMLEGKLIGFAGLDNPDRDLMEICMSIFKMAASFLAVMLRHRDNSGFITEMTHIDQLTGLYSFHIFTISLNKFMFSYYEKKIPGQWCIVCFNISQFKAYNNKYGYTKGNALLNTMGRVIKESIGTDYIARSAADCFFCLIKKDIALKAIEDVHETMLKHGREAVFVYAGVYELEDHEEEAMSAIDKAKAAADRAASDRNHYFRYFENDMMQSMEMDSYIVSHVDDAIENGWIHTWYQPVIRPVSGKIAGMEALARWIDPKYGFLNPGQFVDLLENHHLMHKIDLCMLENICKDIAARREGHEQVIPVSFNISRFDFDLDDIHERINDITDKYKVPHSILSIEITETALLNTKTDVKDHIDRFHRDGYEVWIDDFGSGYSSFNELKTYDFDVLKIDMDFLRHSNKKTPAILSSILYMSRKLGIRTLSEGVEKEEHLRFLENNKCNLIQGYYYSKPGELSNVLDDLAERGIVPENDEDIAFYDRLTHGLFKSHLSAGNFDIFAPENVNKDPQAVIEMRNGQRKTIFSNSAYIRFINQFGFKDTYELDAYENNETNDSSYAEARDTIKKVNEAGGEYDHSFVYNGRFGNIHLSRLIYDDSRAAYAVTVNPLSNSGHGLESLYASDNLQNVLDRSYEAKYITDNDNIVIYANKRTEEILGKPSSEIVGHICKEIIGERYCWEDETICGENCPIRRALDMCNIEDAVGALKGPDGNVKVKVNLVPIKDNQEKVVQLVHLAAVIDRQG
ncbi:MAG: EAL domain-containing protein [Lachnospiraceae bacterium]|nr:EAL domain-containing protein [Lachnospiraceae bacterium]MEE3461467.1 EAL domain-containing protein [Lachnospiraceae bacterium]